MQTFSNHASFANAEMLAPKGHGGCSPFKGETLKIALENAQPVSDGKCKFLRVGPVTVNVFKVDMVRLMCPGVPINQNNVRKIVEEKYTDVATARGSARPLHLAFLIGDVQAGTDLPFNHRIVSAEEEIFALYFKLADVVDSLATQDETEEWVELIRTWPVVMECHPSTESMYWRSINFREALATDYDLLFRSSVQRMFELMQFKHAEEKSKSMAGTSKKSSVLTAKQLFDIWMSNVKFSTLSTGQDRQGGQENKFSLSFVEASVLVYNRLLVHTKVRESILAAEDSAGLVVKFLWIHYVRIFEGLLG